MVVRTYASFRLIGDALEAGAATKELGLDPNVAHDKGGPRPRYPGRVWPTGVWSIGSKERVQSAELDEHLRFLLDVLDPVRDRLLRLMEAQSLRADFFCFVATDGQGGPVLSPETLARIARLRAELGLDIYFEGSEDG